MLLSPLRSVLIFWLFLGHSVLGQTAIVVIKLKDQVVVGADSKRVQGDRKIPVKEPVCKIGASDGLFFSSAGLAYDSKTGFSASSIIKNAPKNKGSIEKKVEHLEVLIKEPLTGILDEYRRNSPAAYAARFKTASALQIVFFGIEKNSMVVLARDFIPTPSPSETVQIQVARYKCPGDCRNGEAIFKLGRYEAIDKFLANSPNYWKNNPILAVRKFIELEIADVPDEVGPPIDILQISRKRVRWIQRKKECGD